VIAVRVHLTFAASFRDDIDPIQLFEKVCQPANAYLSTLSRRIRRIVEKGSGTMYQ